jgi:SSS family solute:Na+ symporter
VSTNLAPLDYAVLLLYLAATLAIGLWVGSRIRTGADFFLAGRSLPWWAIGMSLVATDIGGTDIIGVGGAAYSYGLAVGNFEWIGCVPAMIVAAFVFVPHFWRIGIYTIPEFMERRFNAGVRTALALCWLAFMACNLGIMLLASGKMMHVLMGWDLRLCIVLTALLVSAYTIFGGLAAVVYTDVLQCTVMIGGCLLVTVLGLVEAGGFGPLREQLGSLEQTQLIVPVDTTTPFPWTGIFFGLALVLSPAYWIGNQAIVQRSLGARGEFDAKAAYVWGALLKNLIPFIIVVPGLIAAARFPDLHQGDHAIPTLVATLLPAGLRGMFVAAFIAALMSSVDSYLNSAATILTSDLYRRFLRPAAGEREVLQVGRLATVALMIWALLFAWLATHMQQGLYAIFQTLMALFQGPALAILLTGLLWKRATGPGALVGFLSGIGCSALLYVLSRPEVISWLGWQPLFKISEPYLYFSVWAFVTATMLIVAISLLTRPEPEEKTRYVIQRRPNRSTS